MMILGKLIKNISFQYGRLTEPSVQEAFIFEAAGHDLPNIYFKNELLVINCRILGNLQ